MKSINPDPLTPDQAIDILHRAAAAEGAPIFKDCADVIVSLEKLRTQNEALTKENLELSMVASAKIAKAAAELEALQAENVTFRNAQKACEDCDAITIQEVERLRTQHRELREALERVKNLTNGHVLEIACKALAQTEVKP